VADPALARLARCAAAVKAYPGIVLGRPTTPGDPFAMSRSTRGPAAFRQTLMSHELRAPLNVVVGFSEFLGAGYFGPPNEKQRENVSHILASGHRLLEVVNNILDFARIDTGILRPL